VVVKKSRDLL